MCAGAQTAIFLSYRLVAAVALNTSLSTPETKPATSFLCRLFLPGAAENCKQEGENAFDLVRHLVASPQSVALLASENVDH